MALSPADYIRAGQPQTTDGFGRVGRGGELDYGNETMAERIARLTADTPENNQRKATADAAMAQIERALGRRP